jgi:hypothetical protein
VHAVSGCGLSDSGGVIRAMIGTGNAPVLIEMKPTESHLVQIALR